MATKKGTSPQETIEANGAQEAANELQAAREALQAHEAQIISQCSQELQAILRKHGCSLVATPIIAEGGRLGAQVSIARSGAE